ncbi:hypothetical protein AVEN_120672-1 [Araneus ventricosus]|uniref:Mos1 transposase HTH domain-containing protein n=1 Tax=Araneus ventricosus TaxID=182803 RepID=A0A4Y2P4H3_ARAVE|nr:hypothetical protein AVEN_120672-1 [Araneus ventricosus]
MSSLEQRANIKFCVFLEKSPSETLEMLKKAYGNDAIQKRLCMSGIRVFVKGAQTSKMTLGLGAPEFIPEGQSVNKELYLEILKRLRDGIRRKRPKNGQQTIGFFYTTMLHHIAL